MTNRDMLLDFSRVVEVFKAENDICAVPTLLPLNSVLSVDLLEWFGKFFRFQAHKSWLESVCHIQIQRQSHGARVCKYPITRSFIWPMWLCSLASTTSTCTVRHSPLPPPLWLHQPPSLRRHMGMPTPQLLCRIPIATLTWTTAVESDVNSTRRPVWTFCLASCFRM